MRVSAKHDDPDYVPLPESSHIKIFLDGVEQAPHVNGRAVVAADDCAGEITFHEMVDGDRPYRPFKTNGDRIAEFTARGSVKIVRPGVVDFSALTRF